MVVTIRAAFSGGKAFMPMAAEWVQTGDMPILSAMPSHVSPAVFLAERIMAVTSSLVIMSVIGVVPFLLGYLLQAERGQARMIIWAWPWGIPMKFAFAF